MWTKSELLLFAMASVARAFDEYNYNEGIVEGEGQGGQYGEEELMMPYDYELLENLGDRQTVSEDDSEELLRQGQGQAFNTRIMFSSLENYHVRATPASETEFEFIARVVHSRNMPYPHICTAVCVNIRIFATAARCVRSLKVDYTAVIYSMIQFPSIAFVMPEKPSQQMFDDIGLIVVSNTKALGQWKTIKLFNEVPRKDEYFQWFHQYANDFKSKTLTGSNYYVVGYAMDKRDYQLLNPRTEYLLYQIPNVLVGIDMCSIIFTKNDKKGYFVPRRDFVVPCYLSCRWNFTTLESGSKCPYLGVEGAAVLMKKPFCLLGIATWGPQHSEIGLPVGFSVPNSDTFATDYKCAQKIRNETSTSAFRTGGLPPPKFEC